MKRKIFDRSVPLWSLILALVACASVAIAVIVVYRDISLTMEIKGRYDMEVCGPDSETIIKTIEVGTLYRGDVKRLPGETSVYHIFNTGDYEWWLSYSTADWPSDVALEIYVRIYTKSGVFTLLTKGAVLSSYSAEPGENFECYINITVGSTAPFGPYSPTLTFNAHDTSTV